MKEGKRDPVRRQAEKLGIKMARKGRRERAEEGNRNWNKNEGSYRWRLDLSFDSTLLEKLHLSPAAFGLRIRYGTARKSAAGAFTRDQILC